MTRLASPGQLRASLIRWSLFIVPAVMLLGFLSGQVGGDSNSAWFQSLTKPAIYPPPATFGIVWTILYAMIGFAFAVVCAAWGSRIRGWAIVAFLVHLAANLAWTPVFFGQQQLEAALYVLIAVDVLAVLTTILFFRVRKLAGWLMLPYLGWILFATVLNWQFLQLNPDGGDVDESGAVQTFEL
ncbi:TspO/MBR family protein [Aurantiacibacter aquimixticola]|uniref:Tryptophan-rich sensory protein n=1 Tax=Aurantiacibacter aquimixticola TaxID=1958945 RepID=A0A419RQM2_9SPHN|nr:TspO/MBR family protein [Aurantiacibacter aquimixticola]RJY08074.1 tryptophan-rich sensory protein [Aurantiacibacter aquimixticola]